MSAGSKNHGIYGVSRTPAGGQQPVGYATIAAAIADAADGDLIEVGPGTWAESFTIPAGAIVRGAGQELTLISGTAAGGTRVTLNGDSLLERCSVRCPDDANYGVLHNGTTTATIKDCRFTGNGALGYGIGNTNTGLLHVLNSYYVSGTAAAFAHVTSGALFMNVCRIDGGTLTDGVLATGGVLQIGNLIIQPTATVTDGIELGNATALLSMIALTATNAVHVTHDSASLEATNIFFFGSTWDILIANGITQTGGQFHVDGGELAEIRISADPGWHTNHDVVMSFSDEATDDEAVKFWSEINVGHAEFGRESVFGEGDSYTRGMTVITSDGTATGATEGGNLTDVSTEAQSATGSTFSFQGVTANHCIYLGSALENTTDVLKHWGVKIKQTTAAAEVTPKSFVFEIWNGAAWVAVGIMATHASLFYRYANEVFIRANTSEHVRYGIDTSTTWAKKAISGATLFWSRIRITTDVTTAPVFEQFKLSPSRSELNADGTLTFHGLARYLGRVGTTSNDGESGGISGTSFAVGAAGIPTGWNHVGRDQLMNNNGDAVYYQFALPHGIDTSYPLTLNLYGLKESGGGAGAATFICSALPVEVAGIEEADPTGGTAPVGRTLANSELTTAKNATAVTNNTTFDASVSNKIQLVSFMPYDVSDYYSDDMLLVRLEMDDDGGGANVAALQLEISGLIWTPGEKF